MIFHLKSYPDALRQLFVSISPDETNKAFEQALLSIQKNFSLSGYRKGKVPLELIAQSNPPELSNLITNILTEQALTESKANEQGLYGQARFNAMSGLSRDKEFLFSLVFEIYPTLTKEPNFAKEEFSYEACEIDQAFMEETMARQIGLFDTTTGIIKSGDLVKVAILNEDYSGEKKEANFDTDKLALFIGKKTDEQLEIEFDDLTGYLPEFLGKTTSPLKVKIIEISRPKIWSKVSEADITERTPFKTKAEYLTATQEQFDSVAAQYNKSQKAQAITKTLESKIQIEMPKSLWLNNLRDLSVKIAEKEVIQAEIALKDLPKNEEIQKKFSSLPVDSVEGLAFVIWLDKFSQQEKLTLNSQELEVIYHRHAQHQRMNVADFKKRLSYDDKEHIYAEAIREQAMTLLIDRATFTITSTIPLSEVLKKNHK